MIAYRLADLNLVPWLLFLPISVSASVSAPPGQEGKLRAHRALEWYASVFPTQGTAW